MLVSSWSPRPCRARLGCISRHRNGAPQAPLFHPNRGYTVSVKIPVRALGFSACLSLIETAGGCSSVKTWETCHFDIETTLAENIPTVARVRWSLDGPAIRRAHIELAASEGGETRTIPVETTGPAPRSARLLGMKPDSRYRYTIDVNDGACRSEPQELRTGVAPNTVPPVVFEVGTRLSPGYYILCAGFGPTTDGQLFGPSSMVYIIDGDGDPVWWWMAPQSSSRATVDWAAEYMYMQALNVGGGRGGMYRVALDGTDPEELELLSDAHHDFTVTPEGTVVAITHIRGGDAVVEYDPRANTVTPLVEDVRQLYVGAKPEYHANSITYIERDDAFILGDRYPDLYVKFDRRGELKWQFGGESPLGAAFRGTGTWTANHGHHWTAGKMFIFNNKSIGASPILEFDVDESKLTATRVRSIEAKGYSSLVLGDVQRLPNGNILATYSMAGRIAEYAPDGELLATVKVRGSLGYSMYRSSMYGPPDK